VVPDGYVCVRVDRRARTLAGYLCHNNARETRDIHLCIEWRGASLVERKIGMNGISYYASNQWRAAASQPPHLTAICVWRAGTTPIARAHAMGHHLQLSQELAGNAGEDGTARQASAARKAGSPASSFCGPETLSPGELEETARHWQAFLTREHWDRTMQSAAPISRR